MKKIESNSRVTLHYRITLEDGTVADDTWEDNAPLSFTIGDGTMLPKLEELLINLEQGAEESLLLSPEQAFGHPDSENVHQLDLAARAGRLAQCLFAGHGGARLKLPAVERQMSLAVTS